MTVWLARHGAAEVPPGRAVGWTDVPLSAEGRRQAAALAARLGGVPLTRVHTSDLRRAADTAAAVGVAHGLPVRATADLREIDFGAWEGRRLADLWVERPAEAAAWEADLRRAPSDFGETVAALEARVARFAGSLAGGGHVLVVAHRGSLAVLRSLLGGLSLEEAWRLPMDPGALVRLEPAPC